MSRGELARAAKIRPYEACVWNSMYIVELKKRNKGIKSEPCRLIMLGESFPSGVGLVYRPTGSSIPIYMYIIISSTYTRGPALFLLPYLGVKTFCCQIHTYMNMVKRCCMHGRSNRWRQV